jgi:surface carbohydrate biosynthesis protein (TIGR04326 family)
MKVVIYDSDTDAPSYHNDFTLLLWRNFVDLHIPNSISIPQLVEDYEDLVKTRYLAWIYDLGEMEVDGKRVIDHLAIRHNLSYWWMSLISEKCNFAHSSYITDAIRLMAFDIWASTQSISKVVLITSNHALAECMRVFCLRREINFEWHYTDDNRGNLPFLNRIYTALPIFIQGLVRFFHYFIERWPLRGIGINEWQNSKSKVVFFSYLFNLSPEAIVGDSYESSYWSNLPDYLKQDGLKTSWLHIYCKSTLLPSPKSAAKVIKKLNKKEKSEQLHLTLDSFLTLSVALKAIRDWSRLIFVGKKLEPYISKVSSDGLILWPLFTKDWAKTFYGANAIDNCLLINLFGSAMKLLPNQKVGVYLYEQQPWELALINAWNNHAHGRLIAAQHTTMLYWDLRYFHDPRSYKKMGLNELPMPNKVAVNGPVVQNLMVKSGYPEINLVEVEALRYMHLSRDKKELNMETEDKIMTKRLLVLGDYVRVNTLRQLNFLARALTLLDEKSLIITFKPHPACPIKKIDYPSINMVTTDEPIANLLPDCDIAYTSATTSAAVDAYCSGVKVITLLDPTALNLSPLRGFSDVVFAASSKDLAEAIMSYEVQTKAGLDDKNYFFVDLQFPRWRKLLRDSISLN